MPKCLIGLGANLHSPLRTIQEAGRELSQRFKDFRMSGRYRSAAAGGPENQPTFVNAVACFDSQQTPEEILRVLQDVEQRFHRRREVRWGPRTLDLDLLLLASQQRQTRQLEVPHPRMCLRPFVWEPAAEVAPQLVHPQLGWTLDQLRSFQQHRPRQIHLVILGTERSVTRRQQWLHEIIRRAQFSLDATRDTSTELADPGGAEDDRPGPLKEVSIESWERREAFRAIPPPSVQHWELRVDFVRFLRLPAQELTRTWELTKPDSPNTSRRQAWPLEIVLRLEDRLSQGSRGWVVPTPAGFRTLLSVTGLTLVDEAVGLLAGLTSPLEKLD